MHLLHHHPELAAIAQQRLQAQWGEAVHLHTNPADIAQQPAFGILEPLLLDNTYLSVYGRWLDFFQFQPKSSQGPTIAKFGLAPREAAFEVDLFHLPATFSFSDLPATQELPKLPICSTYHLNGLDIRWSLQRFLRGHGEELFFEPFEQVRTNLDWVDQVLEDGVEYEKARAKYLEPILPETIQRFLQRWQQYERYFTLLPPDWQLAPHREFLPDLQAFLKSDLSLAKWNHYQLGKRVNAIFRILENLRTLYLNSPADE